MSNNDPSIVFAKNCQEEIAALGSETGLSGFALDWPMRAARCNYGLHFSWIVRPIPVPSGYGGDVGTHLG